ncbi:sulfatase-like hydrolase/transferase [Psychrosphaera sp. B3R10]|uniref:sulfatase-like hydrolase/transferase n=1 Tax=unclassified Psychrosphaera TaxID=2641570 RepID=UPI001C086BA0|nr:MULTISPECIES: sulfatase-like hydrolase/transferase [unclassified Psychrosphaera]MBU2881230.1 sulfatase-like hydrolase/transferase [Psychrosphaera sp. I2R16]MBU2990073.1 sulfatase-like hydrolase/transferase [Psychrosphaera sp. B3R10]
MTLRRMLKLSALTLITSFSLLAEEQAKTPNILFLLADDLGYGELGSYGQQTIKTPEIDNLADNGLKFTDFYAGNAVCAPSRAVLMTGKHAGHATIRGNKGIYADTGRWGRVSLRKDELTLGNMMQDAGYQTAFIGKWHLENPNDLDTWAYARGFDYAVQEQWQRADSKIYFDKTTHWINGVNDKKLYDYTEWDNIDEFRTNFATEYLDNIKSDDKPFFLVMSYRTPPPHEPMLRNKSMFSDKDWAEAEKHHARKITLWDKQVGRLIDHLKMIDEFDNTLIILTSDNGGHSAAGHDHKFFTSNGLLRGFKRDLYKGGIRVPHIAVWPGKIKPGVVSKHIGGFQDFMPTFAEVANISKPQFTDGISVLPIYLGKTNQQVEHKYLYWEQQRNSDPKKSLLRAIREGDWKAVQVGTANAIEIYNLKDDMSETTNLAKKYPEKVKRYRQLFADSSTYTAHFPYANE